MQHFYFHHSLLIGDLIYALPGIRQVCRENANQPTPDGNDVFSGKAVIYMHTNQTWPMAPEIKRRGGITLTDQDVAMMRPLLMLQDYIADVLPYNNEPFHVNLDEMMSKYSGNINIPYGCLPRWYFQVWPQMTCDLSKPWISLDKRVQLFAKKVIIVSRSARSHNVNIDYRFLEKYKDRLFFIGLDDEWMSFCRVFFPIQRYEVHDFLELAMALNSCKFFIGNQSFPFAVAEAMKIPRILELYAPLPHVIPTGEHAYDFYHQSCAQYFVEKLMKEL